MDLFAAFPELVERDLAVLHGRSLRLIALSGIVFDDDAFYFELGAERFWGHLPDGRAVVGVGGARARPDAADGVHPWHAGVTRALRNDWRCAVEVFSAGHAHVQGEDGACHRLDDVPLAWPYLFILTSPRLGGGDDVPDALAQAVYLLRLRRWRHAPRRVNLLRIARAALDEFLAPPDWSLDALLACPWSDVLWVHSLPDTALLRPVLALRALQHQPEWLAGVRRVGEVDGGEQGSG